MPWLKWTCLHCQERGIWPEHEPHTNSTLGNLCAVHDLAILSHIFAKNYRSFVLRGRLLDQRIISLDWISSRPPSSNSWWCEKRSEETARSWSLCSNRNTRLERSCLRDQRWKIWTCDGATGKSCRNNGNNFKISDIWEQKFQVWFSRLTSKSSPKLPPSKKKPRCFHFFQGAGDSFCGAFAYFLVKRPELALEEQIRRAAVIASYSVQRKGTRDSYPWPKDLPEELLKWILTIMYWLGWWKK